jgi:hypothetical protein
VFKNYECKADFAASALLVQSGVLLVSHCFLFTFFVRIFKVFCPQTWIVNICHFLFLFRNNEELNRLYIEIQIKGHRQQFSTNTSCDIKSYTTHCKKKAGLWIPITFMRILVWIFTLIRIRIQLFTLIRILLCDHLARRSTLAKLDQLLHGM